MTAQQPPLRPTHTHREHPPLPAAALQWLPGLWMGLGTAAALLSAAGSMVSLLAPPPIYGRETANLADQATAQDLVNLLLVAPLVLVLGWWARRGHLCAYLIWLGCLAFTGYNYAIYAFSIHFGQLFLVWVAVLGLSIFALFGSLVTVDKDAIRACFVARSQRWPGWFLIAAAVLFTLLWLSQIVPDLLARRPSTSASQWNVPTNPVHVLDLAFFLPAVAASGVLLLRRQRWGYATAAGQLTWLALTCLPIMATSFIADVRGHPPGWALLGPIGLMFLLAAITLGRLLQATRTAGRPPEPFPPTNV
jgi:hypothetical protein